MVVVVIAEGKCLPARIKNIRDFSVAVNALVSPSRYLSHGPGVTSHLSNTPIALPALSKGTGFGSPGNASLNKLTYSGIEFQGGNNTVLRCHCHLYRLHHGTFSLFLNIRRPSIPELRNMPSGFVYLRGIARARLATNPTETQPSSAP